MCSNLRALAGYLVRRYKKDEDSLLVHDNNTPSMDVMKEHKVWGVANHSKQELMYKVLAFVKLMF